MFSVIKKTKALEAKIDEFLDTILKASMEFREGLKYYLNGDMEEFEKRSKLVDRLESNADNIRREVENRIYLEMLIPEARGDVLALLENSDNVLNAIADTIVEFSIEKPKFPEDLKDQIENLADVSIEAVEEMVATVRSYFKNLTAVRDHLTKVMFYENESDKVGERIKRQVFTREDLHLCNKLQIRTFVVYLQEIADKAEDVGDRVAIYTMKRLV